MPYFIEYHKIEILLMFGYGDRTRNQNEVVHLFREEYLDLPPTLQGTVSNKYCFEKIKCTQTK